MKPLFFVVLNVLACTISYQVARLFLWHQPHWLRATAILAGVPLVAVFAVVFTGILFGLDVLYLLGLLTAIATALTIAIWKRSDLNRDKPTQHLAAAVDREDLIMQPIALALVVAFGGVLIVRAIWNGTAFFSDDYGYHATAVAHWIIHRDISTPFYNFAGYYPLNAEVFSLWFCLPLLQDAWAGLSSLYWILLAAFVAAAVTAARGQNLSSGLLVGAMVLCSPQLEWQAIKTFSGVDIGIAGLVVAAILVSLAPEMMKQPSSLSRSSCVAYGGLLAGFAVGCKVSVAPVALIILVALTLAHYRAKAYTKFHLGLFAGCCLIGGGYWFAKNLILTGNPLFPAEIGPFRGPLTSSLQAETKLVTLTARNGGNARFWADMVYSYMNWPVGLGLLSVVGYVGALWRQLRMIASHERHPDRLLVQTLLVTGLVLAALHPFMPFSHGSGDGGEAISFYTRYVITSFIIGLILFSRFLDGPSESRWFWRAVAIVCIVTAWPGPGLSAAVAVLFASVGVIVWGSRKQISPWSPIMYPVATTFLFTVLAALTDHQQSKTDINLGNEGGRERPVGAGWLALERLPAGSTIAYFSNMSWHIYPAFGRRFQFRPLFLGPDGTVPRPLHEAFAADPNVLRSTGQVHLEASQFINNLVASGAQYVFVTRWRTQEWPIQHRVVAGMAAAEKVYDDGYSVLWKLPAVVTGFSREDSHSVATLAHPDHSGRSAGDDRRRLDVR